MESGAQGFIAEAEIPCEMWNGDPRPEAQNWPDLIFELNDIDIPKAVATNFAPFVHGRTDVPSDSPEYIGKPFPEKAKPLIDAGWACMTECYLSEAPNATPENTDFYAKKNLKWLETQPILGIYGGKTFADYPTRNNYRNWSVWDAGSVL